MTSFFKERNAQSTCKDHRKDVRDFHLKTGETRTLLPWTTETLDKIHKAMFFRHWLTDGADLWSENRESESWGCVSLLPGGSFQGPAQGWTEAELGGLTGLKSLRHHSRRAQGLEFVKQNQRDGCYTGDGERGTHAAVLFIDRPPGVFGWRQICTGVRGNYSIPLQKRARRTILRVHMGREQLCSHLSRKTL